MTTVTPDALSKRISKLVPKSSRLPALRSTDSKGDAAMVRVKLFSLSTDERVFLTEYTAEDVGYGPHTAFGLWVSPAQPNGLLEYVHLDQMAGVNTHVRIGGQTARLPIPNWERDQWFSPVTLGELKEDLHKYT